MNATNNRVRLRFTAGNSSKGGSGTNKFHQTTPRVRKDRLAKNSLGKKWKGQQVSPLGRGVKRGQTPVKR